MRFPSNYAGAHAPPVSFFDEIQYKWEVRRIPTPHSEADWDDQLHRAALDEGIELPNKMDEIEVEAINSSMSGVTMVSDQTNLQSSIMTQSTAPTSCSSSERRPDTRSSVHSGTIAPVVQAQPFSRTPSKKNSVFRARMRKIVGLGKKEQTNGGSRDSLEEASNTTSPIYSEDQLPVEHGEVKSAPSIRSQKSTWSNAMIPRPSHEDRVDAVALTEGVDYTEMVDCQNKQLEERERFITYRKAAMEQLARERHNAKDEKKIVHGVAVHEKRLEACTGPLRECLSS